MCYALKYGIWNVKEPKMEAVNALVGSGYAPLAAMVLASRGKETPLQAEEYLTCQTPLIDPYRMKDMSLAAGRLAGETVALVNYLPLLVGQAAVHRPPQLMYLFSGGKLFQKVALLCDHLHQFQRCPISTGFNRI